ncbi:MAG: BLUF domain-containing protein [Phreatobacter sp.]|uniref:BLUF domain-containing protein n=1 Tax=Phreatobacter sp. TaxID=1966341 RepID=UPI001A4CAC41|nr:BLUF domain-containing protein [Phreatobacter sp.]MBL8571679.1 BLUF domain-containing protein [Phreatobacter sp.]
MSEDADLIRLTYVSAHELPTDASGFNMAFADIEQVASKANAGAGITGFLVCARRWFAQVIEGPSAAIDALYAKLGADPRHHSLRLVERAVITRRHFPDWHLALGYAAPSTSMVFAVLDFSIDEIPGPDADDRLLDLATDLAAIKRVVT